MRIMSAALVMLSLSVYAYSDSSTRFGIDASYHCFTSPSVSGKYSKGFGTREADYGLALFVKRVMSEDFDIKGYVGYEKSSFELTTKPVDKSVVDEYYEYGMIKEKESVERYINTSLVFGSEIMARQGYFGLLGGIGLSLPITSDYTKNTRYHHVFGRDTTVSKPNNSGDLNALLYAEVGAGIRLTPDFNFIFKYRKDLTDVVSDVTLDKYIIGFSWSFGSLGINQQKSAKIDTVKTTVE